VQSVAQPYDGRDRKRNDRSRRERNICETEHPGQEKHSGEHSEHRRYPGKPQQNEQDQQHAGEGQRGRPGRIDCDEPVQSEIEHRLSGQQQLAIGV
jgi:hypothetical protein